MSRREDIDNSIWVDPDFAALSPDAKLLYLWSFTNPSCNMSGLYKIGAPAFSFGTGLDHERVTVALTDLESAGDGFVFYVDHVLWVRSRVQHLRSRSPQMARAILNDLLKVRSDHPLRVRFLAKYGSDKWLLDDWKRTHPDPIVNLSENPVSKPDSHTLSRPSLEGPGQRQGEGQGSSSSGKVDLPQGFPRELEPHLRTIYRVLRDLAARHGAKAVNPLSLANVVMGRSHKPLVRAAFDCAAHWDGRAQRVKEPVAAYRNWLDKTDDLAGFEQLDDRGLPANGRVTSLKANASSMLREMGFGTDENVVDVEFVEENAA